jgi:hypothetical protein
MPDYACDIRYNLTENYTRIVSPGRAELFSRLYFLPLTGTCHNQYMSLLGHYVAIMTRIGQGLSTKASAGKKCP